MGLLDTWDRRNQRVVDEQMRNPNLGEDDDSPLWPVAVGQLIGGSPALGLVLAIPIGVVVLVWRWVRRRRA